MYNLFVIQMEKELLYHLDIMKFYSCTSGKNYYCPFPVGPFPTDNLLRFGTSALIMVSDDFREFDPLGHSELLRLLGPRIEGINPIPFKTK